MLKRAFDLILSLLGLLILAPFFAVIGVAIKRDSEGPIFFAGERVGRGCKPFKILKFRTMQETPESFNGPRITAQDDPRITRLGRFLRDSKLNELPQLMNVLRGEMSLVGPRPEDPSFVEHYSEEQREVLSVRPGITSLASVIYSDEEKRLVPQDLSVTYLKDILPDKLRLDLLYVRNRSFILDLDILFRTFGVFIPRFRKATTNAEDILLGPFRLLRRLVSWFTIDAVIAVIAVGLAGVIWRAAGPLDVGVVNSIGAALIMSAVFTVMNWITGTQKIQWRYASANEASGVVLSVIVSTSLLVFIDALIAPPRLPVGLFIVAGIFALIGFLTVRYRRQLSSGLVQAIGRYRFPAGAARERVLIVGSGEAGQLAIWLLQNSLGARAFHIVGVVDDNLEKIGTLIHRIPVLGRTIRIPEIVAEDDIDLILFAIHTISPQRRHAILQKCWRSGARTVVVPDILSLLHSDQGDHVENGWLQSGDTLAQDGEPPLVDRELYQAIHLLAELARVGEYARVTEMLGQLDRQISHRNENAGQKEAGEQKNR
jgi:lipopolysaccharide/colanic/teichoic acid biosynthesis glycosyltransferase